MLQFVGFAHFCGSQFQAPNVTAQSALVNQASQGFSAETVFRQLFDLLLLPTPTESNNPKEREDPVSTMGTREEPTFLQLSEASPRNGADKHQQVGTKQTFSKGLFTFFYPPLSAAPTVYGILTQIQILSIFSRPGFKITEIKSHLEH